MTIKLHVFRFNETNMTECRNLDEHFSLKVATSLVPTELPLSVRYLNSSLGKVLKRQLLSHIRKYPFEYWAVKNQKIHTERMPLKKKKRTRCCSSHGGSLKTSSKFGATASPLEKHVSSWDSHFQWEGFRLNRKGLLLKKKKKSATPG